MPLFSRKPSASVELICDVESDAVRMAIARFAPGKAPRIVYDAAEPVESKAHTDGAYLTRRMLKALGTAAEKASAALPDLVAKKLIERPRADRIHYVLSSPWIISRLSCVEKTFPKPVVIRPSTVSALIEEEKKSAQKLFAKGDSMPIDLKLFEIKLNGYPVSDYLGRPAVSIGGTMAVSIGSRGAMSEMRSVVGRSFRAPREAFHSAVFMRYAALRAAVASRADYAWVHVHGELTDVLVVRRGMCALSGSLPFGFRTLERKLSDPSALELSEEGTADKASSEKTGKEAKAALADWIGGVRALLDDGMDSGASDGVYLSSEEHVPTFLGALSGEMPDAGVHTIDPAMLNPFVDSTGAGVGLFPAIYAAALPLARGL